MALNSAAAFYQWAINQPRHGVHTPLPRQMKQIIKLFFAKEGVNAIAEIERAALNEKRVTPAFVGMKQQDASKKAIETRRALRVSPALDSAQELAQSNRTTARQERLARVHRRGLLQGTFSTVSEEKENVAEVERVDVETTVVASAPQTLAAAKPLTATEAAQIVSMGSKEIVDEFGEDRIIATLQKMDTNFKASGSAGQMANRLKHKLTAK